LEATVSAGSRNVTVRITNPGATPALAVHLTLRDNITKKRVLPAYYSDNFFALLPGESREIQIETGATPPPQMAVSLDGWNVTPKTFQQ
jgi:hypothetical protein